MIIEFVTDLKKDFQESAATSGMSVVTTTRLTAKFDALIEMLKVPASSDAAPNPQVATEKQLSVAESKSLAELKLASKQAYLAELRAAKGKGGDSK